MRLRHSRDDANVGEDSSKGNKSSQVNVPYYKLHAERKNNRKQPHKCSQVIGAQAHEAQKRAEDVIQVASQAQQMVQAIASSINVQAQETQKRIQDATQIAMNTQKKVQGKSQIALRAQQTAQAIASTTQRYQTQLARDNP